MATDRARRLTARLAELSVEPSGVTADAVDVVEAHLGVRLPDAVREGMQIWSGGEGLGGIQMRSWDPDVDARWSIPEETLRIRDALAWPPRFVYLAEQAESVIVLDADSGRVSWFPSVLAPKLESESLPENGASIWPDYLSFLLELCELEASDQAEGWER